MNSRFRDYTQEDEDRAQMSQPSALSYRLSDAVIAILFVAVVVALVMEWL